LAGLAAGIFPDPARFADSWRLERRFSPAMEEAKRRQKLTGWKDAVARTLSRPS
jgi:glycerol kinase